METSGITATLPARDLSRAKAFYLDSVGLRAVESNFLEASDGRVGFAVGDGVNQLFVYPAEARSSGEFTQAVLQVTDVRAAVQEMRSRGVTFEEYNTAETQTENGIARTPDRREGACSRTRRATWSVSSLPLRGRTHRCRGNVDTCVPTSLSDGRSSRLRWRHRGCLWSSVDHSVTKCDSCWWRTLAPERARRRRGFPLTMESLCCPAASCCELRWPAVHGSGRPQLTI